MAIIQTRHANYNKPNPALHCGAAKRKVASSNDLIALAKLRHYVNEAARDTNVNRFKYNVSEIYRLTKSMMHDRH